MVQAVGIDFGTTNSVVTLLQDDGRVSAQTWPTATDPVAIFRTALYFWSEGRSPRATIHEVAGPAALERALAGSGEGRFIQSIKTYLASRTIGETRLFSHRFTIERLVGIFLRHLVAGLPPGSAILPVAAGRPVVFAGERPDDALATARLRDAYRMAGIETVELVYEPLGAAYWYARELRQDETVLVADLGGGTSDFSVIRFTRDGQGRLRAAPLAHAGVGVAGDTFDYRLVDHLVAPQLGKGSRYRSFDKSLPFPAYVHAAFAQWHQLSWLKAPQTMRDLQELAAMSETPDAIDKLIAFLELDLGFELYQAISAVKTRLSEADEAVLHFDRHGIVLAGRVTRRTFDDLIAADLARIAAAMEAAVHDAGLGCGDIDAVFLTGGTSRVPAVQRLFVERFPSERVRIGDPLQSVASGLALAAHDRRPA